MDARQFLDDIIAARRVRVLPIAATALFFRASLVTSDSKLRKIKETTTIW